MFGDTYKNYRAAFKEIIKNLKGGKNLLQALCLSLMLSMSNIIYLLK